MGQASKRGRKKVRNRQKYEARNGKIYVYANTLNTDLEPADFRELLDRGYIHSTIAGFNAEYIKYSKKIQISNWTAKFNQQAEEDLKSALNRLKQDSGGEDDENPVTNAVWGPPLSSVKPIESAALPGASTLNHHEIAHRLLYGSQVGAASQKWIEAHEAWSKGYSDYLSQVKDKGLEASETFPPSLYSAARHIIEAIRELDAAVQQYKNIASALGLNTGSPRDDYERTLQDLYSINDFNIISLPKFKRAIVKVSAYFGLSTEYARDVDFLANINDLQDVSQAIARGEISDLKPVAGGSHLSDATFIVQVPSADASHTVLQKMGISYKLRQFDSFDLNVRINPNSLPANFFQNNTSITENDFKYLIYLYYNIRALTEFANDKIIEHRKGYKDPNHKVYNRKMATANTRFKSLVLGLSDISDDLIQFQEALTKRLLLTAFFGNSTDAGQGNILDSNFYQRLLTRYDDPTKSTAPPHYLVTSKYVYRTYTVLKILIDHLLHSKTVKGLGVLTDIQNQYSSDFNYKTLQNIWKRKSQVLEKANNDNIETGRTSEVYTVILSNFTFIFGLKDTDTPDRREINFRISHHIKL